MWETSPIIFSSTWVEKRRNIKKIGKGNKDKKHKAKHEGVAKGKSTLPPTHFPKGQPHVWRR